MPAPPLGTAVPVRNKAGAEHRPLPFFLNKRTTKIQQNKIGKRLLRCGGNCATLNVVIEMMTNRIPKQTTEEHMMNQTMSMQDCARLLQIQSYRIQYAYSHGRLPEPQLRIGGRRLFTSDDLQQLAKHFGVAIPTTNAPTAVVSV
jgi:hypothetical protein